MDSLALIETKPGAYFEFWLDVGDRQLLLDNQNYG
jgi:hypothetical protein